MMVFLKKKKGQLKDMGVIVLWFPIRKDRANILLASILGS